MNTKGAVRQISYGSCLLLLLVLFSCTSIDETLPECQLYVSFRYDYNMEFTDAFAAQVNRVDVFVFDKDGTFIMKKSEPGKTLGSGSYRDVYKRQCFGIQTIPPGVRAYQPPFEENRCCS